MSETPISEKPLVQRKSNSKVNSKIIQKYPQSLKSKSLDKAQTATKYKKVSKKGINKDSLSKKIKRNIFFLDELIMTLDGQEEYISYYEKVVDLKTQSQATYKILYRLSAEKPYYTKTLEMVFKHTNIVSELLED